MGIGSNHSFPTRMRLSWLSTDRSSIGSRSELGLFSNNALSTPKIKAIYISLLSSCGPVYTACFLHRHQVSLILALQIVTIPGNNPGLRQLFFVEN